MRKFLIALAALIGVLIILWFVGPREPFDRSLPFDTTNLPEDLDAHLAASEANIPNLREGAEKEIIWAGDQGEKTNLAIVYIHGFSATKHEIRPAPDKVAEALGANLFYTRLGGHGRNGAAMAEARAGDWWRDMREAIAIGERLGDRIILIGVSTGGTLATLALADDQLARNVAGYIGLSPNYRVKGAPLALLMMPFGRQIVPLIAGAERSWEPLNEEQGKWWTTTYPMTGILPMAATVNEAEQIDHSALTTPALFIFNDADEVVDHVRTREIAAAWGADASIVTLTPKAGEAPAMHVIAGDIVSPSQTQPAADAIIAWINALP